MSKIFKCVHCNKDFTNKGTNALYCSDQCLLDYRSHTDTNTPLTNGSHCKVWNGYKEKDGYGRVKRNGVLVRPHRLSYTINKGPIPNGFVVRHQCDNPACLNPDHLEVGTNQDNTNDRVKRSVVGKSGKLHLPTTQILEIKYSKEKNVCLAKKYDVSPSFVSNIKAGRHRQIDKSVEDDFVTKFHKKSIDI